MSNSAHQPSPHQPVSTTWTEPPWSGWIETTRDALLILEAARRGLIPRVTRRLVDSERRMITSGSVFVFDEDESGIKRWTDGYFWSPSRILGNFLLYRETDKRGAGHRTSRTDQDVPDDAVIEPTIQPKSTNAASMPRSLVGSLTNSYKFKPEGLMKKTFSLSIGGVAQHLISYYKIEDVESGRLRSPSSLPELASLDISPEYLDKTHFRNPPKIEIGADGIPRYRGEADDLDVSPTAIATAIAGPVPVPPMPPLLTEGRVTDGSLKRPRPRYDPYAQPQVGRPRPRKNTRSPPQDGPSVSGENAPSPVASGSSTPSMTARSPANTTQPEPMPVSAPPPPPVTHPQPYGIPAYYPAYPPHLYAAAPQPGVPMAPFPPPPAPGTNNGATSSSSIASTSSPSHQPGAAPIHYGAPYSGYMPTTTVAHPSSSSASTNMTTPTQVRVSDQSQAGLVPISSQQSGPAPVAAPPPPVPGHNGQGVPYAHGPPQYHYQYYPPPPPQFQPPHGYPPAPPGPVAYPWPYAYPIPPLPPHPTGAGHQPQAGPVQPSAASYAPQAQPQQQQQQRGGASTSTRAEDGDTEMEESENV